MKKYYVILGFAILAVGGLSVWFAGAAHGNGKKFRTVPVERGSLRATISATGTLVPEEVVDVGAQVAGQIKEFGPDLRDTRKRIDYCAQVEEGTVLARIDDALYAAQVEQASAALGQAQANVQRAEADLIQMRAKVVQAERDWRRAQSLGPGKANAISGLDYDTVQATFESSKSLVGVGEATLAQVRNAVDQSRAALKQAQINLGYTTVKSPVKGVIIDRRVNVGQTVVANLNAPSLFLIAKDLKRMQIWASVNEADIGQIHPGQTVHFSVDAYPNEVFQGEVYQIRFNASMTQNVVTYPVVINTDNSHLRLLPYQTANVQFEVGENPSTLKVPNSALRWKPQTAQVAPELRAAYVQSQRRRERLGGDKSKTDDRFERGNLWVSASGFVRPIKVRVGLSDGTMTEIFGDDIDEGTEIVLGELRPENEEKTTNPFMPKMFRR